MSTPSASRSERVTPEGRAQLFALREQAGEAAGVEEEDACAAADVPARDGLRDAEERLSRVDRIEHDARLARDAHEEALLLVAHHRVRGALRAVVDHEPLELR